MVPRPAPGAPRIPSGAHSGPRPSPGPTRLENRGVRNPELAPGSCPSPTANNTLLFHVCSRKPAMIVPPPGRRGGPREARRGLQPSAVDSEPLRIWVPGGLRRPVRLPGPGSGGETPWRAPANTEPLPFWTVDSWGGLPPMSLPRGRKELRLRSTVTWPLPVFEGAETVQVPCPSPTALVRSLPEPPPASTAGERVTGPVGPLPPSPHQQPGSAPSPVSQAPHADRHPQPDCCGHRDPSLVPPDADSSLLLVSLPPGPHKGSLPPRPQPGLPLTPGHVRPALPAQQSPQPPEEPQRPEPLLP